MLRLPKRLENRRKKTIGNIDDSAGQKMNPLGPLQPPGVTQPIPSPEDLGLKKTLARSFVTIVIKRDTMQLSVPSHQSQKTSSGLGNLCVGY